jgi:hypothetical protein
MTLMDKYPWAMWRPLNVHPEFRALVLAATMERLTKDDDASGGRSSQRLRLWEAITC